MRNTCMPCVPVGVMLLPLLLAVAVAGCDSATITLDPETKYQTMLGWEATAWSGQGRPDKPDPMYPLFRDRMYDLLVKDVGINRVRLEIPCGVENDKDYFRMTADGTGSYAVWREKRYSTLNDNDDPYDLNSKRFHFSSLDASAEAGVVPLRKRLLEMGEKLYVNLNYVCFTQQFALPPAVHVDPAEYAELMLAAFSHLQNRYGWVPDAIEILLEPDNVPWIEGDLIGRQIVATGKRLADAGFYPDFIAPGTTAMDKAVVYVDEIMEVPGVKNYLGEISYHRYAGGSESALKDIAMRGKKYNLDTSMLEWWSEYNSYRTLHRDLKIGNNSSWQQESIAGHFDINGKDVSINKTTQFTRLYFQYVRRGAVRIEARSSHDVYDPLAWLGRDGKYTVVIKSESGGLVAIKDLPEGTYGVRYTTANQSNVEAADVFIPAGQPLSASIPAAGVIVVYQKTD